ncbi:MAG: indole-3-glycerol phosphate synthase TrpC [Tannerella sp.]|jgi:indole-3-glycerol phosphate synthase|nr:indole-3-glycerol phosphate synthase TrpC [Tannerella sp.]
MKDILETIVAKKRREVIAQKQAIPLDAMLTMGATQMARPVRSMRGALAASASGVIAEFKRRSPSKGWLHPDAKVEDVIPAYEAGGASACSILTDGDFFGGSFSDLRTARALAHIPLLRKDFIIDEFQLFQARVMGADAVLLIASVLKRDECRKLAEIAHTLEMEVLLETHCEAELSYLDENIDMLGVNNRNLGTFETDVENSFRLIEKMRQAVGNNGNSPLLVSESGIAGIAVIKRLREAGFRGFLIGETFMKTQQPGETLRQLINNLCQKN